MKSKLIFNSEYKLWLSDIKTKIRYARLKAAVAVNTQLLEFYWGLGADIVAKQANAKWGDGLIEQLSGDLMSEFPGMKGFSRTNLLYVKKSCLFYSGGNIIVPQPVGQMSGSSLDGIFKIPWGHNREIITSCKSVKEALFYVHSTIKYNWSRSVLVHQIESGLYKREGRNKALCRRRLQGFHHA